MMINYLHDKWQKHGYASGVLAFTPEERRKVTLEAEKDILYRFEAVAFTGLAREQVNYPAVSRPEGFHAVISRGVFAYTAGRGTGMGYELQCRIAGQGEGGRPSMRCATRLTLNLALPRRMILPGSVASIYRIPFRSQSRLLKLKGSVGKHITPVYRTPGGV